MKNATTTTDIRIGDMRWIKRPAGSEGDETKASWTPGVVVGGPMFDQDFPHGSWLVEVNNIPYAINADHIAEIVGDFELMDPMRSLLKLRAEAVRVRAKTEGWA